MKMRIRYNRVLAAAILALMMTGLTGAGRADGVWTTLTEEAAARTETAGDYTGEVRITFLGDCTLGGLENKRKSSLGFVRRIEENGMDFPFRNLTVLTENDDLTVANLEGVLSEALR